MKVNCLWGVLLLVLAGCAQQKIEAQVKESLKDPESARFDKTSISPDGNTAGGVVNAKNSLGGYSGDQLSWSTTAARGFQAKATTGWTWPIAAIPL